MIFITALVMPPSSKTKVDQPSNCLKDEMEEEERRGETEPEY